MNLNKGGKNELKREDSRHSGCAYSLIHLNIAIISEIAFGMLKARQRSKNSPRQL